MFEFSPISPSVTHCIGRDKLYSEFPSISTTYSGKFIFDRHSHSFSFRRYLTLFYTIFVTRHVLKTTMLVYYCVAILCEWASNSSIYVSLTLSGISYVTKSREKFWKSDKKKLTQFQSWIMKYSVGINWPRLIE